MDLNDSNQFTINGVKTLIASKDDSSHRQLRVGTNGVAFLSDDVGYRNVVNIAFRLETWCAENGYSGQKASNDIEWVTRIYNCLKKNWPDPTSTYIDIY